MEKKVYRRVESLFDSISASASEIEHLGWSLFRNAGSATWRDFGAEIARLGDHINWYLANSSDFNDYADFVEKLNLG